MQFNKKSLLQALRHVGRVATKNTVLPILSCVKLTDKVVIGTNLQTTIEADISAIPDLGATFEPVCVEYKKLLEAVSNIPDGVISIMSSGGSVTISGAKASVKLTCENAADFPMKKHEEGEPVTMLFSDFISLAEHLVKFVLSGDGSQFRPGMTGVMFNGEAFCATDAHLLMERRLKEPVSSPAILFPTEVINAAVVTFGALKDDDKITINGNLIETPYARILFQAIEGKFPDYKNIIPSSLDDHSSFKFSKAQVLQAINIVSIGANEASRTGVIDMTADGVSLTANDPDYHNEAKCEIGEAPEMTAALELPFQIGVNLRYFSTMLEAIPDDEITLHFDAPTKAMLLTSNNMLGIGIVLPVMLNV